MEDQTKKMDTEANQKSLDNQSSYISNVEPEDINSEEEDYGDDDNSKDVPEKIDSPPSQERGGRIDDVPPLSDVDHEMDAVNVRSDTMELNEPISDGEVSDKNAGSCDEDSDSSESSARSGRSVRSARSRRSARSEVSAKSARSARSAKSAKSDGSTRSETSAGSEASGKSRTSIAGSEHSPRTGSEHSPRNIQSKESKTSERSDESGHSAGSESECSEEQGSVDGDVVEEDNKSDHHGGSTEGTDADDCRNDQSPANLKEQVDDYKDDSEQETPALLARSVSESSDSADDNMAEMAADSEDKPVQNAENLEIQDGSESENSDDKISENNDVAKNATTDSIMEVDSTEDAKTEENNANDVGSNVIDQDVNGLSDPQNLDAVETEEVDKDRHNSSEESMKIDETVNDVVESNDEIKSGASQDQDDDDEDNDEVT